MLSLEKHKSIMGNEDEILWKCLGKRIENPQKRDTVKRNFIMKERY